MRKIALVSVLLICGFYVFIIPRPLGEDFSSPAYTDDAYQVYNLLLSHNNSNNRVPRTLIIQENTVPDMFNSEPCLTSEAGVRFRGAVADYKRLSKKSWTLKRQFQIEQPYELVNSDTLNALFKQHAWDAFYKRFPSSFGYSVFSAVGFNRNRDRAIFYAGWSCEQACGGWGFHLAEKVNGKWELTSGTTCHATA